MHILHLVDGLRIGGAEKLIVTFAQTIRHFSADLMVATLQQNEPSMVKQIEESGASVIPFHSRKLINPIRFLRLWQFVRQNQFDIIHTHLTSANILGAIIGRLTQTPVFTTIHNTKLSSQNHLYHGRLENWMLKNMTTQVIGVGQEVAERHQQRLGLDQVLALPNAVSIPEPLSESGRIRLRKELVDDPDAIILLAVGRLVAQKGYPDMLRAFATLQKTFPNTRLLIAGQGKERAILSNMIADLNLEDRAILLGMRHDIANLLSAADIFVSTSHWEGLPVSLLEAMAAKKPCVATAVGDVPLVLDNDVGVLVPPHEPALMAEAWVELVENPDKWPVFGEAAYEKVCHEFSASTWVQKQLELYAEAAHVPVPQSHPNSL
jgi:glycosyltransferase involved in cell wall biosynthesis